MMRWETVPTSPDAFIAAFVASFIAVNAIGVEAIITTKLQQHQEKVENR